ncbi:MAG TPA: alpha/beta hydrolase [Candidatus Saccharimonadia bacterium]|nr:alpha/beta hydrolase [Candidatus Saccharimonadia bacterium]
MKTALILHGTDGTPQSNWFPWLKAELEKDGYLVWAAALPNAHKPNMELYVKTLLSTKYDLGSCPMGWDYNKDTLIVGHSSGAVAILGLLQALPKDITVGTCVLVGSFKDDLGWDSLSELFEKPFDFELIKTKAKKFIFVHSDNDPYCPLEHAEYLSKQVGGELIVLPGQGHFSAELNPEYKEFPRLLEIIKEEKEKQ